MLNRAIQLLLVLLLGVAQASSAGLPSKQLAYPRNFLNSGSADAWNDTIAARGGTVSAASLAAVRGLQWCLVNAGIASKIIYLNPRAGNTLTAALTPLVDLYGFGLDQVVSGAGWAEGSGLTGIVVNTGINLAYTSANQFGLSMGLYSLTNDVASPGAYVIGSQSTSFGLNPRVFPGSADLMLYDWFGGNPGRVQGSVAVTNGAGTTTFPTQGLLAGTRNSSGVAATYRNGVIVATSSALVTDPLGGVASASLGPLTVYTAEVASGLDFVGTAMDQNDILVMTWCAHQMNKSLGTPRAVTADGLF